jgi:hypothetical protein
MMEREQLEAIAAARGRPVGAKHTSRHLNARHLSAIAARGKGRATQRKSISALLGSSTHRSITALRPNAKPRS